MILPIVFVTAVVAYRIEIGKPDSSKLASVTYLLIFINALFGMVFLLYLYASQSYRGTGWPTTFNAVSTRLLDCEYVAIQTMTTVGYGDLCGAYATSRMDKVIFSFMMIVSTIFWAIIVGIVSETIRRLYDTR